MAKSSKHLLDFQEMTFAPARLQNIAPPMIERLENRDVPAFAGLVGTVLNITGTPNRDVIDVTVDPATSEIVVLDAGAEIGRFAPAGVTSVAAILGDGADIFDVSDSVTLPVSVDGGSGPDILLAGGGPSTLIGGAGDDRIAGSALADLIDGGDGNDRIYGNAGLDTINGGAGKDRITTGNDPTLVNGGAGNDLLQGGSGADTINGDAGSDKIIGDAGNDSLSGNTGNDLILAGLGNDTLSGDGGNNRLIAGGGADLNADTGQLLSIGAAPAAAAIEAQVAAQLGTGNGQTLQQNEVDALLQRAAGASASNDAIIAIVDRNGTILGVRVESGVSPAITGNIDSLVFAIDGAVAEARTGAFFASNQAPLTSRTIQYISQTTITEREVESYPSITDENSANRGPGFVAPIGIGSHFPPGVAFTPQVDLFAIEHTNRDSNFAPGPDRVLGTADDIPLTGRFNIDPAFVPAGRELPIPLSYGRQSGLRPLAVSRGIGTLPGGIPIVENGVVVGGIGVFFPGQTGFANESNSNLSADYDPTRPDRAKEAEYIAFAAVGGSSGAGFPIGTIAGVPALPGFDLPFGRIDLVGITLDLFGAQREGGVSRLVFEGSQLGVGDPNSGTNQIVAPATTLLPGQPTPEGWLVTPHDGASLSANDVVSIISQGINEALQVRAAIRLPLDSRTRMIFSVTDLDGQVLGLYRMPDATYFSIDVSVTKARNVGYYDDATSLQPVDRLPDVPAGVAFTARTFRYVALPRYPEGIDNSPPGTFSILNDGGTNGLTGLNNSAPLPASAFQSVQGFDAFHPGTNFRDPNNLANQSGIIYFPGSSAIYADTNGDGNLELVGGFGVSGDGVDQDDVVTASGISGFNAPDGLRADEYFHNTIRLPYQKFNRNPRG